MAIRKYKFHRIIVILNKALPRQYLDLEISSSFRSQGGRERGKKEEERKKKRLFVSSPSTFHRPPIIHLSYEILERLLSSFFHEVASLSGYRINPSPGDTTSKPEARRSSSPPWCNTGYPIEHHSSLSLFSSPSPSTIVTSLSLSLSTIPAEFQF